MNTVDRLAALLEATPDTGEGGKFHRRSEFLWQLRDDLRRIEARDESLLAEFEDGYTFERAHAACMADAQRALERWVEEGPSVCSFCWGQPVGDAATWVDGKPRPPAPCPRCGETYSEAA